jgi:hypothetical protein
MKKRTNFLQKLKPKDTEKMYFASIAMIILSFVVLGIALASNTKNTVNSSSTKVQSQRPFEIGEVFTSGQVKLQVSAVDFSAGTQPFIAPETMQYAVVRLHITNQSDHPINILPTTDTYIKSADGTVSYLSPFGLKDPFRGGELLPGESVQGELSYLIKKDQPSKFYIDSIWSGAVIPVKLN